MADLSALETLYFPNRWSKKHPPERVVPNHLDFCTKESEIARQLIPCSLNIAYGTLDKEKYDIFGTDLSNESPIFVFIHGGYWQKEYLGRDTYHFIATSLYKIGMKSIFIGYELCPKVTLADIVNEVVIGVGKSLQYAEEKRSKGVVLAGYSSGAHLLASIFTRNLSLQYRGLIRSVLLIAGIYDLRQLPLLPSINEALNLNEESAAIFSPYLSELEDASYVVVAAGDDSPEFQKQSRLFFEKIQKGRSAEFIKVDNCDHFEVVELFVRDDYELTHLIKRKLSTI